MKKAIQECVYEIVCGKCGSSDNLVNSPKGYDTKEYSVTSGNEGTKKYPIKGEEGFVEMRFA